MTAHILYIHAKSDMEALPFNFMRGGVGDKIHERERVCREFVFSWCVRWLTENDEALRSIRGAASELSVSSGLIH